MNDGERSRQWPQRGGTQQIAVALHAESPVHAGDVVAGRYRVENVVGVGGMGIVVAGVHVDLHQRVAIKLVLPSVMNDDVLRERFLREARAAAQLRSEHVAKVLDVGRLASGVPYMVMERLEGCDLAALIANSGPLASGVAADYIAQACEAVAEAHAHGIIHRDIKPQNLFVTTCVGGAPLVKVLDFGVSKVSIAGAESLTKSMMVMGSPLYMSPEQMRSARDADARSDIWSLGVVLYELLTGHVPFDCVSIPALCLKVATDAPPSLTVERPDLPRELVAVVMRCLEKQPRDRYASAKDLAAALAPFVAARTAKPEFTRGAGMHSEAPVVSDPMTFAASRGRRVKTTTLAAIVTALFACGAIAGIVTSRSSAVTPRFANASMASVVTIAASTIPAASPADPIASAPLPTPETAPPPVKPLAAPTPPAPRLPSKPTSDDDEIPSMR